MNGFKYLVVYPKPPKQLKPLKIFLNAIKMAQLLRTIISVYVSLLLRSRSTKCKFQYFTSQRRYCEELDILMFFADLIHFINNQISRSTLRETTLSSLASIYFDSMVFHTDIKPYFKFTSPFE